MTPLPLTRRRGAASAENILVVTFIAVVLISAVTLFGRKISALYRAGVDSLKAGEPVAAGTVVEPGAPPGGIPSGLAGHGKIKIGDKSFGSQLSDEDDKLVEQALAKLPKAVSGTPITQVEYLNEKGALYNFNNGNLYLNKGVIHPNGKDGYNTYLKNMYGVNAGYTLEQVLYHEMMHAYHDKNPGEVNKFLDLGYQKKLDKLKADPKYQEAKDRAIKLETELEALANKSGKTLDQYLLDNPKARDAWYQVNQEISNLMEKHKLPSRYRGDDHAADESTEYFAIVMEIARYEPEKFQYYRNLHNDGIPGNEVLSQEEIEWIDKHPELWK